MSSRLNDLQKASEVGSLGPTVSEVQPVVAEAAPRRFLTPQPTGSWGRGDLELCVCLFIYLFFYFLPQAQRTVPPTSEYVFVCAGTLFLGRLEQTPDHSK